MSVSLNVVGALTVHEHIRTLAIFVRACTADYLLPVHQRSITDTELQTATFLLRRALLPRCLSTTVISRLYQVARRQNITCTIDVINVKMKIKNVKKR